ncbi:hypothetical protein EJ02DRAFT_86112 [Clathrospora elynae]|uniref:Uncharacterized protein n=1 Tax=Clathrospora elynae TaxID=706981 RepID=A0A6A5SA13_9PLEO|nr:hypothetical protein EJ02DRAFT_86112 [Clathrospora elynae]
MRRISKPSHQLVSMGGLRRRNKPHRTLRVSSCESSRNRRRGEGRRILEHKLLRIEGRCRWLCFTVVVDTYINGINALFIADTCTNVHPNVNANRLTRANVIDNTTNPRTHDPDLFSAFKLRRQQRIHHRSSCRPRPDIPHHRRRSSPHNTATQTKRGESKPRRYIRGTCEYRFTKAVCRKRWQLRGCAARDIRSAV